MAKQFLQFLSNNITVSLNEADAILASNKLVEIKKGEYLVKAGDHCKEFFFVEAGLLRQFSTDRADKEHILHFAAENWFVGDRDSALFNTPAMYSIQALEPTVLYMLDADFLNEVFKENIEYTELFNRLLHNHVRHLQKRINQLLSSTAEERYLDFLDLHPSIMQRVPQSMVASYLGIAPESLSRVRKELLNQKR